MKNSFISEIFQDFISLIYPLVCEACGRTLVKGEDLLCTFCIVDFPRCDFHQDKNNVLTTKFRGRMPITHAMAFMRFRKKGSVQKILHALKYKNRPDIAVKLGSVYGEELNKQNIAMEFDFIIPVPLHQSRQNYRGYNQSEKWAEGISKATGIPVQSGILVRNRKTVTQTKKTKFKRWENVHDVFSVKNQQTIKGKRILLVDDVVTTGATLEACGIALHEAGCNEIGIACIAYVD